MTQHTLVRDERTWQVKCTACGQEMWHPLEVATECAPIATRELAYAAARAAGGTHYDGLMAWRNPSSMLDVAALEGATP